MITFCVGQTVEAWHNRRWNRATVTEVLACGWFRVKLEGDNRNFVRQADKLRLPITNR